MRENDWQSVKKIFLAALEIPAPGRARFIAESGGENTEVIKEVESLLAAHESDTGFIETPAVDLASILFNTATNGAGKMFGNYRIIKEIGRGGMGAVFLAERSDGEFSQQVAIKIIRQAIAESEIISRFKRERQILAFLNHPNIAQLLDGGVSDDGLPFLAMEYVEGEAITKFAARENLNLEERLKLFLKVCSAVAYAHRNLIVHRDIKPSNIFVTKAGEPKLLDFGLAKLLDENLSGDAAQTQTAFRALTPAYASPEQLKNELITTASDIYSLGIVLYELLTGDRPFYFEGKSLDEIIKTATQIEPPLPSAISLFLQKPAQNKDVFVRNVKHAYFVRVSAFLKKIPGSKRNPQLKGDLDNIALTALRKEPTRRYKSVEAFADDIERYLKGLPVAARPNTFKYRAEKFIKRHKVGVFAASLILLSLIGGIVVSLWQARIAQREKVKAEVVNGFLQNMLNYSDPDVNLATVEEREITVNDVLNDASKRLENGELADQPEIKAELQTIIGSSYLSQGKYDLAEKNLREAVEAKTKLYGENNLETVKTLTTLGSLFLAKSDFANAERIFRPVLPILRAEQKNGDVRPEVLILSLHEFAVLRRAQGDSKEAESLLREGLTLCPLLSDKNAGSINQTQTTLALTLADQGKIDEAEKIAREIVLESRQNGKSGTPNFGYSLTALGNYLTEKKNFAEAGAVLSEAEEIYRRTLSPQHLFLGDNLRIQAFSLYQQYRFTEAEAKITETLKIYRESSKSQYINFPTALTIQGLIFNRTNRTDEAEKTLREAVKIRLENLPKEHFLSAFSISALGECLTAQKHFNEAEPLLVESWENLKNSQGADNPRAQIARRRVSMLYETWEKTEKAKKIR